MAKVIFKVEASVLNENRMRETEGDVDDSPPQRRKFIESSVKMPEKVIAAQCATDTHPENAKSYDQHRIRVRFQAEESGVQAAEPTYFSIGKRPDVHGEPF